MGCDIHCYAERKNKDGKWEIVGNVKKEEDGWISIDYEPYHDRNYNLFDILANVSNETEFAGYETGEGFNPISNPKGVPSDASEEYASLYEQWDSDGHSHSYLTLRELLDYDWTQTTQIQGLVDIKYSQCVDSFLSDTIFELLKLAGGTKGIDNIRIVFFFDN